MLSRYVEAHQAELQTAMDAYFDYGQPLACDGSISAVNNWPGQHPMIEYILFTSRGYHGFLYSPDDVPLAFQNASLPPNRSQGRLAVARRRRPSRLHSPPVPLLVLF